MILRGTIWVTLLMAAAGCWPERTEPATALRDVPTDQRLQRLRHGDADQRIQAARALGNAGDQRAVEPLTATLRASDPAVRIAAARALGRLQAHQAVGALVATLQNDAEPHVRAAAALGLRMIGDPLAIPGLLAALGDGHPIVAREAGDALAAVGRPAVEPLSQTARHDATRRPWAVRALRQMDDLVARRAVEELTDEHDKEHTQ
ncbi:MAG: hypothetical protein GVY16_01330 [Planctomycetes bacterium]|jgi:HEAT repeat protein|nr:hypothetical protein [Planctomycetota bacterium]